MQGKEQQEEEGALSTSVSIGNISKCYLNSACDIYLMAIGI